MNEVESAKLLAALKAEESQAVGYQTSTEVTLHTEALDRYFGKPYGDEVDGRSKITTREVYETIQWTLPDLLDIFAAGGRICDLETDDEQAEAETEERADYLDYVFFKDNNGVLVLYDFIFDAMAHPRSYVDVDWDDRPSYSGWEEYENLTQLQIEQLIADPATELDALKEQQVDPSPEFPMGVAYSVKARKKLRDGCCKIEVVPPEDMFVAGRSVTLGQARYKGRLLRWRRSTWKEQFPKKRKDIEEYSAGDESTAIDSDERRAARFDDDNASDGEWSTAANKAAEELVGRKEYIWWADPEGDDDAKLYRVYRLGDMILEAEEVDDDPFASSVSDRVPHRLNGLSIPEVLGDLQRLKTVLTRALVDGTMQSNVPRVAADKNAVNLDDLLNLSHGAVIRVDGAPGDKLMPFQTPDLTPGTLSALQWTDQIAEQRTGVSRHAQGLDPDALNHTAKGIQLLQNAANARKRLMARLIAQGVEDMMTKVDRTVMRHQKSERSVKLGKAWKRVDPRSWSPAMRVKVTVGLGTGAKDVQLAFLQMIQQDQMLAYQTFGPQNPVVTLKHLHHTMTQKLRVMGYPSPEPFVGDPVGPDGQEWKPQPQPSPEQQKIQAQIQEGQAKLQLSQQTAQQDFQLNQAKTQAQLQADQAAMQAKAQADAQKAQTDAEIARFEAEGRLQIAREEMNAKMVLAQQQAVFEANLAREKMQAEIELAKMKIEAMPKKPNGSANGSVSGSDANFGGQVG